MKCNRCDAEIAPNRVFCSNCGNRVTTTDSEMESKAPTRGVKHMGFKTNGSKKPASLQSPTKPVQTAEIPAVVRSAPFSKPPQEDVAVKEVMSVEEAPERGPWLKRIVVTLFVLLGLIFITGGLWAYLGELPLLGEFPLADVLEDVLPTTRNQMINLVPQTTDIYMELSIDEKADQNEELKALWQLFPKAAEWQSAWEGMLGIGETAEEGAVTWEADVKPWLGKQMNLMINFPVSDAENQEWHIGMVWSTTDLDKTKSFINRLVSSEGARTSQLSYRETEITKIESKNEVVESLSDENSLIDNGETETVETSSGFLAYLGNYLVITNTESYMYDVINGWKDGGDFSEKTGYKEVEDGLPNKPVARIYIDKTAYRKYYPELDSSWSLLADSMLGCRSQLYLLDGEASSDLLGLAILPEQDRLSIIEADDNNSAELEALGYQLYDATYKPTLMAVLPASSAVVVAGNDLKTGLTNWLHNYALVTEEETRTDYTELFKQVIEDPLQVVFLVDIMGRLSGEYAFAITPGTSMPAFNLVISVADQENADQLLAAAERLIVYMLDLISPVLAEGQETAEYTFAERQQEGISYKVLEESNIATVFSVAYGLVGENLVISSDLSGFEAMIAVSAGSQTALSEDTIYQAVAGELPEKVSSLWYINRALVWDILGSVYEVIPSVEGTSTLPIEALDTDLAPLQALMGSVVVEDGSEQAQLDILINP